MYVCNDGGSQGRWIRSRPRRQIPRVPASERPLCEVGRGTGQGLAIARSVVVDRHKGTLTSESDVGRGSTFYVRLPLEPADCPKEAKPAMVLG